MKKKVCVSQSILLNMLAAACGDLGQVMAPGVGVQATPAEGPAALPTALEVASHSAQSRARAARARRRRV